MKLLALVVILSTLTLQGCSGPSYVEMTPVPPPHYDRPAVPRDQPKTPAAAFSDEAADEFLKEEIARKTALEPKPVVVERVVYAERPREDRYEQDYRREHDRYKSKFPWHTAAGAGLGAVIGHQSGHRDEGALIGAGVGLLMDLAR